MDCLFAKIFIIHEPKTNNFSMYSSCKNTIIFYPDGSKKRIPSDQQKYTSPMESLHPLNHRLRELSGLPSVERPDKYRKEVKIFN